MKRVVILLLISLFIPAYTQASKLSEYFHKMDAREKARAQQEWKQDMDFADKAFRLRRHFINKQGERCREYALRSRSHPELHGQYILCEENFGHFR